MLFGLLLLQFLMVETDLQENYLLNYLLIYLLKTFMATKIPIEEKNCGIWT